MWGGGLLHVCLKHAPAKSRLATTSLFDATYICMGWGWGTKGPLGHAK